MAGSFACRGWVGPCRHRRALAQIAPVGGDHYAARESDTGFAGAVSSSGGYGTSVPLDLPAARGGLKVPVQVVYGGRRFGAAGLGWDVPLSFIRRDVRVAHRRPANIPDASPQPREQLTLTLDGMARPRAQRRRHGLGGAPQ